MYSKNILQRGNKIDSKCNRLNCSISHTICCLGKYASFCLLSGWVVLLPLKGIVAKIRCVTFCSLCIVLFNVEPLWHNLQIMRKSSAVIVYFFPRCVFIWKTITYIVIQCY